MKKEVGRVVKDKDGNPKIKMEDKEFLEKHELRFIANFRFMADSVGSLSLNLFR